MRCPGGDLGRGGLGETMGDVFWGRPWERCSGGDLWRGVLGDLGRGVLGRHLEGYSGGDLGRGVLRETLAEVSWGRPWERCHEETLGGVVPGESLVEVSWGRHLVSGKEVLDIWGGPNKCSLN